MWLSFPSALSLGAPVRVCRKRGWHTLESSLGERKGLPQVLGPGGTWRVPSPPLPCTLGHGCSTWGLAHRVRQETDGIGVRHSRLLLQRTFPVSLKEWLLGDFPFLSNGSLVMLRACEMVGTPPHLLSPSLPGAGGSEPIQVPRSQLAGWAWEEKPALETLLRQRCGDSCGDKGEAPVPVLGVCVTQFHLGRGFGAGAGCARHSWDLGCTSVHHQQLCRGSGVWLEPGWVGREQGSQRPSQERNSRASS